MNHVCSKATSKIRAIKDSSHQPFIYKILLSQLTKSNACQDIWGNVFERIMRIMLWISECVRIWEATSRDYQRNQSEGSLELKRGEHVQGQDGVRNKAQISSPLLSTRNPRGKGNPCMGGGCSDSISGVIKRFSGPRWHYSELVRDRVQLQSFSTLLTVVVVVVELWQGLLVCRMGRTLKRTTPFWSPRQKWRLSDCDNCNLNWYRRQEQLHATNALLWSVSFSNPAVIHK